MQAIAIRRFEIGDASNVSQLIIANLLLDNVHDYGAAAVRQLAQFYSPRLVLEYAQNAEMVVAVERSRIVGTAALEQNRVRNVFVRIDHHRQGIGGILMRHIEETAIRQGKARLFLQANISAVGFYQRLGYVPVEEIEENIGDIKIKMVLMEKYCQQPVGPGINASENPSALERCGDETIL